MIYRRQCCERRGAIAMKSFLLTKFVSDRASQPEEVQDCLFVGLKLTQRYPVGNSVNN
jgi:hypothetical protein